MAKCRVEKGYCIDCGRTLDQIARWGSMPEDERNRLMNELGYNCPGCGRALPVVENGAPCLCPGCGVHCCEGSV